MHDQNGKPCPAERTETVAVLESHIDHLTGEELGDVFDRLQEAGALDVLWIPGIMKKNRPGGALRVICLPERLAEVQTAFFRHTHTLGIRRAFMERVVLPREETREDTERGPIRAKRYEVEGVHYVRPEHDELSRLAAKEGVGLPALRFANKKSR